MKFGCRRGISFFVRFLLCLGFLPFPFSMVFAPRVLAEEKQALVGDSSRRKVTLQFQGMDILEVLKLLAEQAGFNLVAGRNVTGKVTLFIREVDPFEALEVILAANELAYEHRGQILTIMTQRDYELLYGQPYQDRRVVRSITPRYAKAADLSRSLSQVKSNIGRVIADEATNTLILMDTPPLVEQMAQLVEKMDQPLTTRIFSLNYSPVKGLAPLLEGAVTKGVGKVSPDERTNQVSITDYPAKLEEIAGVLKAFDERSSQVLIDTKILQVALSNKFQMGIDWEALARENITVKGLGALNLTSGGSVKIAQASVAQEGDYKVLLEALRIFGDTKVLSEPRLTVVNNQEAKILVGSKEPYVTTQISQTGTGTAITAETVNYIDVGVKLFVTPTIARDGFISMKIRPEVSSKTGSLTTAQKNEIPIVETAEAETVLLVEDGATVILGGLIKDDSSVDHQRIPILGDIPGLGIFFRSTKTSSKKTELVVFLAPRILTGAKAGRLVEAPSDLDEGGYSALLQDRIQSVARVQALLDSTRGRVAVKFTLSPEGRVVGSPKVVTSDAKGLESMAEQAVLVASPFPPFPSSFRQEPRSFSVSVTYE